VGADVQRLGHVLVIRNAGPLVLVGRRDDQGVHRRVFDAVLGGEVGGYVDVAFAPHPLVAGPFGVTPGEAQVDAEHVRVENGPTVEVGIHNVADDPVTH